MKKLLAIIGWLFLLTGVAAAVCPVGSTCENYNGTIPYAATGGTATRTPAARATDQGVNFFDFSGVDPTGVADSTDGIQAAIDCSYGTGTGCSGFSSGHAFCPDGVYKITRPLFFDAPGNLRGNPTAYNAATAYTIGQIAGYLGIPWVSLNALSSITLGAGGTGYVTGDKIVLIGGAGTTWTIPAIITVTASAGVVTGVQSIVSGGSYSADPGNNTWTSQALTGNGSGATFTTPVFATNTGNTPSTDLALYTRPVHWTPTVVSNPASGAYAPIVRGISTPGDTAGCRIKPTYNNAVGIYSAYANGATIENIGVYFTTSGAQGTGYGCGMPPTGIGIAIPGGAGAASGTTLLNVRVSGVFAKAVTGYNADGIGSENVFDHFLGSGSDTACYGVKFGATQNFTNSFHKSFLCGTINISALDGQDVRVYGGSYGPCGEFARGNTFTISSTSALTAIAVGNNRNISFSTTVASPDTYLQACSGLAPQAGNAQDAATPAVLCPYNAFTIVTAHFGVIPLMLQGFDTASGVAHFIGLPNWAYTRIVSNNIANTDLEAEIQAVTTLYAAEISTQFLGSNISAEGTHVETSDNGAIQLAYSVSLCCTSSVLGLRNVYVNSDATLSNDRFGGPLSNPAANARFLAAQFFPYIHLGSGVGLNIQGGSLGLPTSAIDRVTFDVDNNGRLDVREQVNFLGPNIRYNNLNSSGGQFTSGLANNCTLAYGCGTWDTNYFAANVPTGLNGPLSMNASPMWGYRPALTATPRIGPSMLTGAGNMNCSGGPPLTCILPAISPSSVPYTLLSADAFYSSSDWDSNALAHAFFRSAHLFYSYGQNFTGTNVTGLNWSYKGQSWALYLCATPPPGGTCTANETAFFSLLFPGLGIQLNNGSGNVSYMITAVHPNMGYVDVVNAGQDGAPLLLAGTKTVVYTCPNAGGGGANQCPGAVTIGQPAYSITQYP